jgi:hypothetical protein
MAPQSMTLPTRKLVGEHVLSEANGYRSREHIFILPQLIVLQPGTILGMVAEGNQAVAGVAQAGNVGNGVFAAPPTADAGVPAGRYQVLLEGVAANGGLFGVYDPDGVRLGDVAVGAAYNGPINFTLNDGATDFAIGDGFDVTVSYAGGNTGLYGPLDPAANNGLENFAAVLFGRAPIKTVAGREVGHVRDCEINEKKITLVNALNGGQLAAMKAQARAAGVLFSGGR